MLVLYLDIIKKTNMLPFINPTPILITLVTVFGILMHDMHIDKATTAALTIPSTSAASTETVEKVISPSYHTHVERTSLPRAGAFRTTLPNVQPPRDDDRRYIQNKKLCFAGGTDTAPLWPSV